jgi:hypothetical protein
MEKENYIRLLFRSENISGQRKAIVEKKKEGYELFDIENLDNGKILLRFQLRGQDAKEKNNP